MTKFIPISPTTLSTMITCPRQFEAKYLTKEVQFKDTPATIHGTRLHKAMEDSLVQDAALPAEFSYLQPYVDKFKNFPGKVSSETKLAIDKQGNPCEWKDRYIGGIADVITIKGSHAFIGDLKTGKYKEDTLQLSILTKCLYANYPTIQTVNAALFFPHINKLFSFKTSRETVTYEGLEKEIKFYEAVIERGEFKPKPGGLCRQWCDVFSCPHNGRNK
ncbi:hypothetical protein V757_03225 [Pelistega indica]|uniref:Uncharacterized protein n=1 Tax=Pelistega indica TaxID=1414851 RepID=V8G882_9BURK|nr:PD-(D/E)XK nuclease family protein [Pelistega indica]ETD72610.1 hypothetical protein V757_03225 [Pelistega indica]